MKKTIINICLSIFSIAALVLLIEGLFIIFDYDPLCQRLKDFKIDNDKKIFVQPVKDKDIVYELKPDTEIVFPQYTVKINSLGFRDKEYSKTKKVETTRIAVIGDSTTFGFDIDNQFTYSKQLEDYLCKKGEPIEVLNLGVNGYNIVQVISQLEKKWVKLSPDIVIYGFCLNDLSDFSDSLRFFKKDPITFQISKIKSRFLRFVLLRLYKSELITPPEVNLNMIEEITKNDKTDFYLNEREKILREKIRKIERKDLLNIGYTHGVFSYRKKRHILLLNRQLRKFSQLSKKYKFVPVIVIIPMLHSGDTGKYPLTEINNLIEYEAEEYGISVINPLNALIKRDIKSFRRRPKDVCHLNQKGNKILADQIAKALISKKILP
ncbi:MAG: SGNH/GDSL hydrolase family protein [Candidatus Omnitrophica bacterium]|nr:SGNH/GDSL hydrolase family protein [Candidatus Omnitrophota bacterium]